jgi:hypothetical protein
MFTNFLIFLVIQAAGLALSLRLIRFAALPPDVPLAPGFVAFLPPAPRLPVEARTGAEGWL